MSGTVPKLINPPKPRVLGGAMWRHLSGPVGKQPRSSRVDAEPELIIPAGLRLSLCRMTVCPCIAFPAHPVGPTLTGFSAVWGISQPLYRGSWKRDSNVSGTDGACTNPLNDSSLWEVGGLWRETFLCWQHEGKHEGEGEAGQHMAAPDGSH